MPEFLCRFSSPTAELCERINEGITRKYYKLRYLLKNLSVFYFLYRYFYFMESYQLLQTIYEISKHDSKPETYPCKPRELILRLKEDWFLIQQLLQELEREKLISTVQQDTLVIRITKEGIEKIIELQSILST